MRFNEKELKTLASQHKCEKEGCLYFAEKQEGFFRKTEGTHKCSVKSLFIEKERKKLVIFQQWPNFNFFLECQFLKYVLLKFSCALLIH